MNRLVFAAFAMCLGAFVPGSGEACGDKPVALGSGGVRFERLFQSRHPGTIVMLATPQSGVDAANRDAQVKDALEKVGHKVRTVANRQELDRALKDETTDLVLADQSEAAALNAEHGALSGPTVMVPLLYRPTKAEFVTARNAMSCFARVSGRRADPVLRVVEYVRLRQKSGQSIQCIQGAGAQS